MGCMKAEVLQEAIVHDVDPYSIISSSDTIKVCLVTSAITKRTIHSYMYVIHRGIRVKIIGGAHQH